MSDVRLEVSSEYVTVRDGTELAVYLFRPLADRPVPTVWAHDRYHQVSAPPANPEFAEVIQLLIGSEEPVAPDLWPTTPGVASLRSFPWAERLLREGIAVVIADSRGSGASGGVSSGPFAPTETDDLYDVTEWIARQPWCNGKIGMAGRSYLGISQYLAMSAAPPHLVAVFPQMALFDLYGFAYDGGIFRGDFAAAWGEIVRLRDCADPAVAVDSDPDGARLAQYRAAHGQNADVRTLFARNTGRHDPDPVTGERIYQERSPSARIEEINGSGVAVYSLGGWHDVWARDTLRWAQRLRVPHRTVIGPWSHTSGLAGGVRFNLIDEHARWFGHWLKGEPGDDVPDGAVRYYAMGSKSRGGWRTAAQWPPADLGLTRLYLAPDGQLAAAPSADVIAEHRIDYAASSGRHSRWSSGYGGSFDYSGLSANDAHGAVWTSGALAAATELTGEATLQLALDPAPVQRDVFAYLQCVSPDGTVRYVTEGCIRVAPSHDGDVAVTMQPVCWVFDPGDRLKVTLCGSDRDNADTPVVDPAPLLRLRGGSALELPACLARPEPASPAQQSIWLAEQVSDQRSAYHLPAVVEFDSPIDEAALSAAVDQVVSRHEALRTTLRSDDGPVLQFIHPPAPLEPALLTVDETAGARAGGWESGPAVRAFVDRPFDLAREWPLRWGLVRLPGDRNAVVLVLHHVAGDQQAVATFFAEIAALYARITTGEGAALPSLAMTYADAAERQRTYVSSTVGAADADYWREHLRGAPEFLDLPLDHQRGDRLDAVGGYVAVVVDEQLTSALRRLAVSANTSLYTVLLTAYALTVSTFAGTNDVVVAVPNMDRGSKAELGLIGCFVNVLPVRLQVDDRATLGETLRSVRGTVLDALRHRRLPFDTIVAACARTRQGGTQPLAQTSMRVIPAVPPIVPFGAITARPRAVETGYVKYDLAATVEDAACLSVRFEFRTAIFDAPTVESIAATFTRTLARMVETPDSAAGTACAAPEAGYVDVADLEPALHAELLRNGVRLPEGGTACVMSAAKASVPVGAWGYLHVADPSGPPLDTGLRARLAGRSARLVLAPKNAGRGPAADQADHAGELVPDAVAAMATTVAAVWADLLGQEEVTAADDFFDLGGDSLTAIRLIARVRKATGVKLSLKDVLTTPTLGAQAELLLSRTVGEA